MTPGDAQRIGQVLRAMEKTMHAGELLGTLYGLRRVLRLGGISLGELATWIEGWAAYEDAVRRDAEVVEDGIMAEVLAEERELTNGGG